MDIALRAFLDADEFIQLLELASSLGGSVLYQLQLGGPFARVEPGAPLPDELTHLLRAPLVRGSPHLLYIGVGDPASDPKAMDNQKSIAAYFGGFDDKALYLSSIGLRSTYPEALALARRLKKWIAGIAKARVEVIGSPGGVRKPVAGLHSSERAARVARAGLELRQRGGANIRYEIIADGGADASPAKAPKAAKKSR